MPVSPWRPCAARGCNVLVRGGRCARHEARPNADERAWYSSQRWQRVRAVVLVEEPWCLECERQGVREPNTDVDHRVPHRGEARLFWDRANLNGKCHRHHAMKTRRGE